MLGMVQLNMSKCLRSAERQIRMREAANKGVRSGQFTSVILSVVTRVSWERIRQSRSSSSCRVPRGNWAVLPIVISRTEYGISGLDLINSKR